MNNINYKIYKLKKIYSYPELKKIDFENKKLKNKKEMT